MLIKITTEQEYNQIIQNGVVVVDFYADWCGPCKMLGPVMQELATEYDNKVNILKVNVDEFEVLASKYNVSSIPLVVIIKDGKTVENILGYRPKNFYAEIIEKLL